MHPFVHLPVILPHHHSTPLPLPSILTLQLLSSLQILSSCSIFAQLSGIEFLGLLLQPLTVTIPSYFNNTTAVPFDHGLSQIHQSSEVVRFLSWLTSLANLFLPSLTPPLIVVPELFQSPQLIALFTTRIETVQNSPTLFPLRGRRKFNPNIAKITYHRHGLHHEDLLVESPSISV